MAEKIGLIAAVAIFGIFVLPTFMDVFERQNDATKFLTLTTEVQQLISAEGGVTHNVTSLTDRIKDKVTIAFSDTEGNTVTGKVDPGEVIIIDYSYKDLTTTNAVTVLRR